MSPSASKTSKNGQELKSMEAYYMSSNVKSDKENQPPNESVRLKSSSFDAKKHSHGQKDQNLK